MRIFVIGNVVEFIACKISGNFDVGGANTMDENGATLGNDAPIVAAALSNMGYSVSLYSINRVSKKLLDKLEEYKVELYTHDLCENSTVTIMLEDEKGLRTFINSRSKQTPIGIIKSECEWVYVDFYDENVEYLKQLVTTNAGFFMNHSIWINVSSSDVISKCQVISELPMRKKVIQLSIDIIEADSIIDQIHSLIADAIVIATCGSKGSIFNIDGKKTYYKPQNKNDDCSYVGAGAFFAANVIDAYSRRKEYTYAQRCATENVCKLCSYKRMFLLDSMRINGEIGRNE